MQINGRHSNVLLSHCKAIYRVTKELEILVQRNSNAFSSFNGLVLLPPSGFPSKELTFSTL